MTKRRGADEELIGRYTAGVIPLPPKPQRVLRGGAGRAAPAERHLGDPEPSFEIRDDGSRLEGRRVDVASHVLARLSRGEMQIQASLDLHGLFSDEAKKAVETFVARSHAAGIRGLLIIHGKGSHSPGGYARLRSEIAGWLTSGRAAARVSCFATARPPDGGTGALYVWLMRTSPKAVP